MTSSIDAGWRQQLYQWIEQRWVQQAVIGVIIANAAILGLETVPRVNEPYGDLLYTLDRLCLTIFVVELTVAMIAMGPARFFRDPWRVFDFVVVGIALVPATGAFSVLRSLRVLRVLRLVSASPRMRKVVAALLQAIPGLSSIATLLLLIFYVAAVMSTKLFGEHFPEWFGSIGASMYTLFQVMTLESWSMGIVRPILAEFPYAWLFFVPFIMVATFTILNLFIAVIVEAMQSQAQAAQAEQMHEIEALAEEKESALHRDIDKLRDEIRELKAILAQQR
ncbi:ion transporter [Desulfurivibrio alkaliphilus]|uniref:Ion transport protein n=1 Tax=Desulfurivibrio alkaliphilus (strain DSM 19089 / UNIQEM U267 / AHT2) TaxID=589865 RepID=D6Z5D3_DESAT|nr:ion transporter [Desulfurivibrio alkaliphilus]ADH84790.1 Ion transport protein [Desulfurivibrio alkaliphilus AHT 2]